jgi:hypothetical protein
VAADGGGRNSPFTAALLRELPQPDVEIGVLFRRVAVAVNKATEGRQTPELSLSLMGEFYFKRAGKLAADKGEEAGIVSEQDRERQLRERLTRLEDEKKRAAEELAAMEKANREKARREAAEREALLNAQAEKERLAREQQVERDRIAKLEAERKRLAEDLAAREKADQERLVRDKAALDAEVARLEAERKATQERLAALEAARKEGAAKADVARADAAKADDRPVQQAALPSADDAPKAKSVAESAPSGPVLVRAIQGELKRLGCYAGAVDQRWGSPSMKRALAGFSRHASLPSPKEPEDEFLDRLKGQQARVCPLVCGPRDVARGGVCVAKVCPTGSRLDTDGECVPRKEEKPRATAHVPTDIRVDRPVKAPEARQAPATASRSTKIEELRQRARARCSARINPLRDPEGRTCEQLQSELFALERQR